jgi:pilus assembly protein CpaD
MSEERSTMRMSPWLASLAALILGACANGSEPLHPTPLTPSEHFAIEVKPEPQELKLAAHDTGLSSAQTNALRDFAHQWMQTPGQVISVRSPEHGPDPAAAYRTATDARDQLVAEGVAPASVRIVSYDGGGDSHAPIVVGYLSYRAHGPDCGRSWSNLSAVDNNEEYPEFGCADTANIAAEMANPADLVSPRPSDPADAQRRDDVIYRYRQGQVTSSAKDPQADGTFSQIGGH